jgi:hypothetical protein
LKTSQSAKPGQARQVYVTNVSFGPDFQETFFRDRPILYYTNAKLMSTMKMINNAGLKSRIRQVLFLLIVIVIAILISRALGV